MDETTKRESLGERIEPGGRTPAPPRLRIVQQFVNTWNHEFPRSWDHLGTATLAAAWLVDHGLLLPSDALSERDRKQLVQFRESLRGVLVLRSGDVLDPESLRTLNTLDVSLEVLFDDAGASDLQPVEDGIRGSIGRILALAHEASVEGSWGRLKGCRQCGWIFYDRSRNRSGSWCSMSVCGNRSKNRSYRGRMRPQAPRRD